VNDDARGQRSAQQIWVNRGLLDRIIVDRDGEHVGMVDDLEFTEVDGELEWTAVLCGPAALGGRIGGRLGTLWSEIGGRARATTGPTPVRTSVEDIAKVDVREVRLTISAEGTDLNRSRNWVKDAIIARIPGSGA
jgi:hypothetical protein